jgi:gamma-glutamyltranspeptidase/glutathione hydrolase
MVSAAHPLATAAGLEILRAGGSATDAAITVQLVLSLVEPQSSGIGGGGFLLHFDARTGRISSIDGRETAPASVREDLFLKPDGTPKSFLEAIAGGRTVGVPGAMAMMELAHQRYGKLPWARLFDPAIRIAQDGFAVGPRLHAMVASARTILLDFPAARALYLTAEGQPVPVGTIIRSPDYARFLATLARDGARAFYTGANARAIVEAVSTSPRAPAQMTLRDLSAYRAIARPPVCGTYRGHQLCLMGPPSSGATTVLATLKMLERFDLKAMGANSLQATHVIAQAMGLAFADRNRFIADPAFVRVPVAGLLDPTYLLNRSQLITTGRTTGRYTPGSPPALRQAAMAPTNGPDIPGTSHWAVVDSAGNAVSFTGTVQGPFGAFLLIDGYFLNNELTDFAFNPRTEQDPSINRAEPGKRPLSSMSPTIVTDANGRFLLAVGSAGGQRIIAHTIKTLIGVLDWGLDVQEAIELPNVTGMAAAMDVEQGTALEALKPQLEALGHKVTARPIVSGLHGIQAVRDADGRLLHYLGGADPRREGIVQGD